MKRRKRMGNTSEVLYVESNKKRINAFGTLTGLQLPVGGVNSTNTILPSSEKVNNKNSIRDSVKDSKYLELAKNPEKNEARLREMVEQAAKANGYVSLLYHGSESEKNRAKMIFLLT